MNFQFNQFVYDCVCFCFMLNFMQIRFCFCWTRQYSPCYMYTKTLFYAYYKYHLKIVNFFAFEVVFLRKIFSLDEENAMVSKQIYCLSLWFCIDKIFWVPNECALRHSRFNFFFIFFWNTHKFRNSDLRELNHVKNGLYDVRMT